jgi:hypothetical protein
MVEGSSATSKMDAPGRASSSVASVVEGEDEASVDLVLCMRSVFNPIPVWVAFQ